MTSYMWAVHVGRKVSGSNHSLIVRRNLHGLNMTPGMCMCGGVSVVRLGRCGWKVAG